MPSSKLQAVIMSLPFIRQTMLPLKMNNPSYYYYTADGVAEQSCLCGLLNQTVAKKKTLLKTKISNHFRKTGSCAPPIYLYVISKAKTDKHMYLYEMQKQHELNVTTASK